LEAAFDETQLLTDAYVDQANAVGLDETMAHLRPLSFERMRGASGGGGGEAAAGEEEEEDDAYVPGKRTLAVFDVDDPEGQFGELSFATLADLEAILRSSVVNKSSGGGGDGQMDGSEFGPGGVGQLKAVLQAQLALQYATMVAVEFREVCSHLNDSDLEQVADGVRLADAAALPAKVVSSLTSFVELRRIKAGARARMHAEYRRLCGASSGGASGRAVELRMVGTYNLALVDEMGKYSLRTQSSRYIRGLKLLLDHFPSTRDYSFQVRLPPGSAGLLASLALSCCGFACLPSDLKRCKV
jgi:hypothetical protein